MTRTFAIVGASLAGARAAQALRSAGFDGRILLIGDEPCAPYERPPLSKSALLSDYEPAWVCPKQLFDELSITLITGRKVVQLQQAAVFKLMLDDGETFEAEKVLLATGGRARRLPAAEGLEHVYYLRSWADAQRLKCALRPGARVAVIGSGFIGAEVAATASVAGCRVEILEAAPRVFGAIHSPIIHEQLCNAHKAAGVQLRAGVQIDKIANLSGGGVAITLQDGEILAADFTVVGIGMVPNTALADALGVRLAAAGIAVDENYQTSVTGLYAAGDVATRSIGVAPGGRVRRIEHWRNAQEQGVGAAAGMLGRQSAELPTAWCWSDQHGHRLEIAGDPEPRHARVERCLGEHKHVTFHLDGTRLAGVTALNAPRVVRDSLSRLATPWYPEACQLADPDRPLSKVESVLDDSEISQ